MENEKSNSVKTPIEAKGRKFSRKPKERPEVIVKPQKGYSYADVLPNLIQNLRTEGKETSF